MARSARSCSSRSLFSGAFTASVIRLNEGDGRLSRPGCKGVLPQTAPTAYPSKFQILLSVPVRHSPQPLPLLSMHKGKAAGLQIDVYCCNIQQ